jgi:hypothetical protein
LVSTSASSAGVRLGDEVAIASRSGRSGGFYNFFVGRVAHLSHVVATSKKFSQQLFTIMFKRRGCRRGRGTCLLGSVKIKRTKLQNRLCKKWISFSNNIHLRMPFCSGLTTCEMV